eukprot:TRINITY_DN1463_c0_g1_i1.p1 TRINITY_DN1463_c0_g1~~TRINITY_DN1463_c0_g1_i1.p1  ORF type:complete len:934 (+),score=273.26 TRINITY_DN1463_c0_g1_i1:41-2842(+)
MGSSAIPFLYEDDESLQEYSLNSILQTIDVDWLFLTDHVETIIKIAETNNESLKLLCFDVLSRFYFYIEDFLTSVRFALFRLDIFDFNDTSLYTRTTISNCIGYYIDFCNNRIEEIHPNLEKFVDIIMENTQHTGDYRSSLGIAIEAQNISLLKLILSSVKNNQEKKDLLRYLITVSLQTVKSIQLRHEILDLVVELFAEDIEGMTGVDACSIASVLQALNDSRRLSKHLEFLTTNDYLAALQIVFNVAETASQIFRAELRELLENSNEIARDKIEIFCEILTGERISELELRVRHRGSSSDLEIMKAIQIRIKSKQTLAITATCLANALMFAGTTIDTFVRSNQPFVTLPKHWSHFSLIASIGVIHQGQLMKGKRVLNKFLPNEDAKITDPFSAGGAIFGFGLIYANNGLDHVPYLARVLENHIDDEKADPLLHGLGLTFGLCSMGTGSSEVKELLEGLIRRDNCVYSQAAAVGLGLLFEGWGDNAPADILELLESILKTTRHDKVAHGVGIALACIYLASEQTALPLIERLIDSESSSVRYAAVLILQTAFVGTGNGDIVKKLLHIGVSDVNDDVRRTAVIGIAFVFCRQPERVVEMLKLLSRSYNPHVRFGVALAIGLSNAGTGDELSVQILRTLGKDMNNFVRQAAFIAQGLVLQQISPNVNKTAKHFRTDMLSLLKEQMEKLAQFGAILGLGLVDAGGRNAIFSMTIPVAGAKQIVHRNVIGGLLFSQFWHWHPFIHFISLSLTTNSVIGLDKTLQMPLYTILCNQKESMFANPPKYQPPKEIRKKATVNLKVKKYLKESRKSADAKREAATKVEEIPVKVEEEPIDEPNEFTMESPCRVTIQQRPYVDLEWDDNWSPVDPTKKVGIVILRRNGDEEGIKYVIPQKGKVSPTKMEKLNDKESPKIEEEEEEADRTTIDDFPIEDQMQA